MARIDRGQVSAAVKLIKRALFNIEALYGMPADDIGGMALKLQSDAREVLILASRMPLIIPDESKEEAAS